MKLSGCIMIAVLIYGIWNCGVALAHYYQRQEQHHISTVSVAKTILGENK